MIAHCAIKEHHMDSRYGLALNNIAVTQKGSCRSSLATSPSHRSDICPASLRGTLNLSGDAKDAVCHCRCICCKYRHSKLIARGHWKYTMTSRLRRWSTKEGCPIAQLAKSPPVRPCSARCDLPGLVGRKYGPWHVLEVHVAYKFTLEGSSTRHGKL